MECLPVLDFSVKDRASNAKKLVNIMETVGFMYLENVPGYSEDELRWCQEFFFDHMPVERKLELARTMYNPDNKNVRM
jgi:isopenicillin N synthase-like dioxygenase